MLRTVLSLTMASLVLLTLVAPSVAAAESDGVVLEVITSKARYPLGTRPVAVIRLTNAGSSPATIRAGWGRTLPMEFVGAEAVQPDGSAVDVAVSLIRFGPVPTPPADQDRLQTQEPAAGRDELTLPAGGRAQWLVQVPVTLERAGAKEIPWAMPPLVAEQAGRTIPLTSRGTLIVTAQTPAACMADAGVTVTASAVSEDDVDLLRLAFRAEPGRLPQACDLQRECLVGIEQDGTRRQDLLMPGGQAAEVLFGGPHTAADLDLPLINADLLAGATLPGRMQLTWNWRQWFPDQAATAVSAQVARFEIAAAWLAQPAQLPDGWTWPRRDDAGTYPEAGRWLAVDVEAAVSCNAQGRVVGTPRVQVDREGR